MLDNTMKAQLKAYLERLTKPVELVATLDDGDKSKEVRQLLADIKELNDKITVVEDNAADVRKPSFLITNPGTNVGVRFAGVPLGHEFTSLVLALLQVGGHPSKESAELLEQVKNIDTPLHFETFYSLSCHNCPDVVQALNLMSVLNPKITHTAIDGGLFQKEVQEREIMGVPTVFVNGQRFGQGRMELAEIVAKVDTGAAAREAQKISAKEAFDVLIVGGGPAGAAAAIYAARKGIRTGIAAERLGGQVLDTVDIENFISVSKTDGPKFAAAMESHIRDYEVDIMNLQTAKSLTPAAQAGGLIEIETESGAKLKARTVI
ncbi:MAG: thioredoxin family protein, partial [Comamonas sp.]|nr:thioredoxin family protein [Comamonas sp.]